MVLAQRAHWSNDAIADFAATNIEGVLLTREQSDEAILALRQAGLITVSTAENADTNVDHVITAADIASIQVGVHDVMDTARLWASIQSAIGSRTLVSVTSSDRQTLVSWMLQLSLPLVPVITLPDAPLVREDTELLRSLVFWRRRFGIALQPPSLVHAGDGLLLYRAGGWLVALNLSPEDLPIGLEHDGSMWLMLGTHREAQLQGELLDLPAYSGAILANERAAQGGHR